MNINLETRYTILESDSQQFHYEPRNEAAVCVCVCVFECTSNGLTVNE